RKNGARSLHCGATAVTDKVAGGTVDARTSNRSKAVAARHYPALGLAIREYGPARPRRVDLVAAHGGHRDRQRCASRRRGLSERNRGADALAGRGPGLRASLAAVDKTPALARSANAGVAPPVIDRNPRTGFGHACVSLRKDIVEAGFRCLTRRAQG